MMRRDGIRVFALADRTIGLEPRAPSPAYVERGVKPRRIDPVTRVRLALLSRFFKWRDALVVRPETMIR